MCLLWTIAIPYAERLIFMSHLPNTDPAQARQRIDLGFQLGFVLFGLFLVAGALVFLIAGVFGAEGTPQICIAAGLGPLIGGGIFLLWWITREPVPPTPPTTPL
jgi:hypothetical protein